jgi:hypothetical protein
MHLPDHYRGDLANQRTWTGISPIDRSILQRHILANAFAPKAVWFNVPVGLDPLADLRASPNPQPPSIATNWSKKIDLVFDDGRQLWIAEIKPAAGYVALGQVQVYTHWAQKQYDELAHAKPLIITDALDPDVEPCCTNSEIQVLQLPGSRFIPIGTPT